ncbi:MAG: hypothetical protein ACJA07_001967 [Rhodococcus sp. (in: high G+C Gram-positive bacteria)]|jgi:predicted nucleotidyltransferase
MDPMSVLASEFSDIPGVERVVIFGSWAARRLGIGGHPPGDIDLLCLGHRQVRKAVYVAANVAEVRLAKQCNISIPVNPIVRSASSWLTDVDPLIREIRSCPYIDLELYRDA